MHFNLGGMLHQTFIEYVVKVSFQKHDSAVQRRIYALHFLKQIFWYFWKHFKNKLTSLFWLYSLKINVKKCMISISNRPCPWMSKTYFFLWKIIYEKKSTSFVHIFRLFGWNLLKKLNISKRRNIKQSFS